MVKQEDIQDLDWALLNDNMDRSYLELNGICLASANSWNESEYKEMQERIHETISLLALLVLDFKEGKLSYNDRH